MDIVLRATFAYVFILFLLRVLGRRELSTMTPSDLILLVVMGDLIQNGVTQSDYSVTGIALATSTIGLLAVATSWLVFRSRRARRIIEGEPIILIEHGKPIEPNLRSQRVTLDEVREEMRIQQIEALGDVKWGILESSGQMSFIKTK